MTIALRLQRAERNLDTARYTASSIAVGPPGSTAISFRSTSSMDCVELANNRGRSENVVAKYSSSGFAFLKNSTIAARSVSILLLILLLTSSSIATEIGYYSAEKYRDSGCLSSA